MPWATPKKSLTHLVTLCNAEHMKIRPWQPAVLGLAIAASMFTPLLFTIAYTAYGTELAARMLAVIAVLSFLAVWSLRLAWVDAKRAPSGKQAWAWATYAGIALLILCILFFLVTFTILGCWDTSACRAIGDEQ